MVKKEVSDDELRRLDAGGVRGVRFNFVAHLGRGADLDAVRSITRRIADLGWHLVIHFDAARLKELAPVLKELPVTMVIDHMGRVDASQGLDQEPFRLLRDLMADERFWVKVCGPERISRAGPPFMDAVPFARALIDEFPDRVLWGTDWPHPNIRRDMPDDGHLVDLVAAMAPDETACRRLLVDNPTRLYWAQD
jgi:2-pyrone-4,6-dicarboxylate lactonase